MLEPPVLIKEHDAVADQFSEDLVDRAYGCR
jgi:hypothetical protein